jgi:hypothetical protein
METDGGGGSGGTSSMMKRDLKSRIELAGGVHIGRRIRVCPGLIDDAVVEQLTERFPLKKTIYSNIIVARFVRTSSDSKVLRGSQKQTNQLLNILLLLENTRNERSHFSVSPLVCKKSWADGIQIYFN